MNKFFNICLGLLVVLFISHELQAAYIGVQVIEDVEKFKNNNPDLQLIPLNKNGSLLTLGKRVDGDRIVQSIVVIKSLSFEKAPEAHSDVKFTCIAILPKLESHFDVYVLSGGVGHDYVELVLHLLNQGEEDLSYRAFAYGM